MSEGCQSLVFRNPPKLRTVSDVVQWIKLRPLATRRSLVYCRATDGPSMGRNALAPNHKRFQVQETRIVKRDRMPVRPCRDRV